ncbi:hypothetical protein RI367_006888 [Sorochytrium milnesiophthora]
MQLLRMMAFALWSTAYALQPSTDSFVREEPTPNETCITALPLDPRYDRQPAGGVFLQPKLGANLQWSNFQSTHARCWLDSGGYVHPFNSPPPWLSTGARTAVYSGYSITAYEGKAVRINLQKLATGYIFAVEVIQEGHPFVIFDGTSPEPLSVDLPYCDATTYKLGDTCQLPGDQDSTLHYLVLVDSSTVAVKYGWPMEVTIYTPNAVRDLVPKTNLCGGKEGERYSVASEGPLLDRVKFCEPKEAAAGQ